MMATIPGLRSSMMIFLGAAVVLFFGVAPTPAQAHCKGKHAFPHEHCADGESPADFDPELVWVNGGGFAISSIVIANGDGSNPTTIGDGRNPSWSPGGKEILFTRDATDISPTSIYRLPIFDGIVDPEGFKPRGNFSVGAPEPVVTSDADGFFQMKARWSPKRAPDGHYWIAYTDIVGETGSLEVFLFKPASGEKIQLTETDEDYLNLTWSHDATRIAVITVPGNVELEDILVYSLTAEIDVVTGNKVLVPNPTPVSLLLNNIEIDKVPASNAGMLKQAAIDPSALEFVDWANTGDRLIVRSDGDSGRNRLWIVPVPVDNTQEEVANGTILALDDDRLAVFRNWPNWSPNDTALLYRRSGKGGICEVPSKKKGKTKSTTNLVIGMLDNPDVEDDPPGTDDPDKIDCDIRPADETVLNSDGLYPEWWRRTFPQPPLPLPAP